jgi:hypothetical protein
MERRSLRFISAVEIAQSIITRRDKTVRGARGVPALRSTRSQSAAPQGVCFANFETSVGGKMLQLVKESILGSCASP